MECELEVRDKLPTPLCSVKALGDTRLGTRVLAELGLENTLATVGVLNRILESLTSWSMGASRDSM